MRLHTLQLLLFSLILVSCARTTVVSGRITNIRTGNPVVGMPVTLNVYNGNEPRDSSNPKKVGDTSTKTGSNGEYALEYTDVGIDAVGLFLDNGEICYSYFGAVRSDKVKTNGSSEVNIQIDSIDGKLQLILQNLSGQSDKLYLRVDCDATGEKGYACCSINFNNTIPAGQSDTVTFRISAGRFVPVYWGETIFTGWNAPRVDSVFCPRNQTTPMVISF